MTMWTTIRKRLSARCHSGIRLRGGCVNCRVLLWGRKRCDTCSTGATGNFGGVTEIRITKIGGGTSDLNYFILTSNTDTGEGPATGFESACSGDADFPWVGVRFGYDRQFYVKNPVDCIGMDEFYIDEPAPPSIFDSGTSASLLGMAMLGLAAARRKLGAA
jgi:hypothetical protein